MSCCCSKTYNVNKVKPVHHDTEGDIATVQYGRVNGFSCPLHPLQFIGWFFIILFAAFKGVNIMTVDKRGSSRFSLTSKKLPKFGAGLHFSSKCLSFRTPKCYPKRTWPDNEFIPSLP